VEQGEAAAADKSQAGAAGRSVAALAVEEPDLGKHRWRQTARQTGERSSKMQYSTMSLIRNQAEQSVELLLCRKGVVEVKSWQDDGDGET
jgi:hypothetical protein